MKEKIKYGYWIFLPLIVGSIVGFIIKDFINYDSLVKPFLSPKPIVFPIAWTILYLIIGLSYFIYRKNYNEKKVVYTYYLQLLFNYLWTIIFFVFKWYLLSVAWIIILIIEVIFLYIYYLKRSKLSSYLLIPYIIWLLFACYLNIGIYLLN